MKPNPNQPARVGCYKRDDEMMRDDERRRDEEIIVSSSVNYIILYLI